jgi:hypothetical protein
VSTIHELGGQVARVPGDELITYFESAAHALQAAARLRNLAIAWPLAVAVHHGPVELSASGGVFGQTVNVALRMVRMGEIGEALATGEVRDALETAPPGRLAEGTRMRLGDRSVEVFPVSELASDNLPEIPGLIRERSAVEFTCVCGSQGVIVTGRLHEGEPIRARCRGCNRQLSVVPYADEVVGAGLWDTLPDRATSVPVVPAAVVPAAAAVDGGARQPTHDDDRYLPDDSPTEDDVPAANAEGVARRFSELD